MFDAPGTYPLFDGFTLKIYDSHLCKADHGGEENWSRKSVNYRYSFMIRRKEWTPLVEQLPLLYRVNVMFENCGCYVRYKTGDEKERKKPGRIIFLVEEHVQRDNILLYHTLTRMKIFPMPKLLPIEDVAVVMLRFNDDFSTAEYCYADIFWSTSIQKGIASMSDTWRILHSYVVCQLVLHLQSTLPFDLISLVASYS